MIFLPRSPCIRSYSHSTADFRFPSVYSRVVFLDLEFQDGLSLSAPKSIVFS